MLHNIKYSLKILFREKTLVFWTFIFPILLSTFFNIAFADMEKNESFNQFNIAVIENEQFNNNEAFKETFKKLSNKESDSYLFNIKYTSKDKAQELLKDGEVIGYVELLDTTNNVVVSNNGINETILKTVVEEISETNLIINNLIISEVEEAISSNNVIDYEQIYKNAMEKLENSNSNIKNITKSNLSYTMIEFYTLIAMACLYGGMLGITAINQNLANMSSKGKRVSISPISKGKAVISSVIASYLTSIIGIFLLIVYTVFVLKVDYGDNMLLVIILSLAGSLAGVTLGMAIGTALKISENTKTGILLAITMLGCFLAGMMGIVMKYIIDTNLPFLNIINPANMITDGFYSLYYYDTLNKYYFNLGSLIIFSLIMIIISCFSLRRKKYDSI